MRAKALLLVICLAGLLAAAYGRSLIISKIASAPLQSAGDITILNRSDVGVHSRGEVRFNHKRHETLVNPDPTWRYNLLINPSFIVDSQPGGDRQYSVKTSEAACVGCHHSLNNVGIPRLAKCGICHGPEGQPLKAPVKFVYPNSSESIAMNPRNLIGDEVFTERAFHDNCIGCHRAVIQNGVPAREAPITCNGCHVTGTSR